MGRAEGRSISLGSQLEKSLTGIKGLDGITKADCQRATDTGLWRRRVREDNARGRVLVKGALQFGEPGVFMSFEETSDELTKNVASLGFKLDDLVAQKRIPSTTFKLTEARSKRPASMTWRGYLYALNMRSLRSAPSAWCWIPSKCSFPAYPILCGTGRA